MTEEITLYLPDEISNFVSNLAFEEEISSSKAIIKILTLYYHNLYQEEGETEIPEELDMLKKEENLLTISDTFKKEFNESD
jgi:hypothetical protein